MRAPLLVATLVLALACGGAGETSQGGAGTGAVAAVGGTGTSTAAGGATSASGGAEAGGSTGLADAGGAVGAALGGAGAIPAGGGDTVSGGSAAVGGSPDGVAGGAPPAGGAGTAGGAAGAPAQGGSGGAVPITAGCPPKGTPCKIMPLGDSITYGYGSTTGGGYRVPLFSKALADSKSITFVGSVISGPDSVSGQTFPKGNEGHSGYSIDNSSSTKGISPLVDQAISTYKPNIILLMIGTNDMHYSLDLANAPTRLGNLLDQITTDAPNALVVVAQIIPANGAQNTPTQSYNAAIPGVVQARVAKGKHLVVVNQYAALKSWSSAEFKDSEHPNDTGYSLMADTWYPAIKGALP